MGQRGSARAGRDRGEGLSQKALEPLHRPVKSERRHRIRTVVGCVLADGFAERLLGARDIAKIIGAGELIVIDVVILGSLSGMPSNRRSMSFSETMLTPHLPTSPSESG